MPGIFPNPGDVVTFPGAATPANRTRRYVVTDWYGNLMVFVPEDAPDVSFNYLYVDLWRIGMALAPTERAAV
jgi:hypothetical protein